MLEFHTEGPAGWSYLDDQVLCASGRGARSGIHQPQLRPSLSRSTGGAPRTTIHPQSARHTARFSRVHRRSR